MGTARNRSRQRISYSRPGWVRSVYEYSAPNCTPMAAADAFVSSSVAVAKPTSAEAGGADGPKATRALSMSALNSLVFCSTRAGWLSTLASEWLRGCPTRFAARTGA